YDQCMGEAFVNQDQGAAGYFGATDVSYSFYNDSLAIGIFRGICEQHIYNFQTACDYGKWFMEQYFPLPNGITKKTFFMMNILGDPSLDMWTDTPKTLTVNYPSNTMPGSEFTVEVTHSGNGVKEALVCIWKGNEIYDSQYTNASGQATFTIPPDATKGPMNVTVTAHNYRPHEGKTYILHMYSYSPKATAYNNGRRIVRDSKGRYHLVYESDGKVYYTYSDDNGTHWAPENNISEYYDKNKSLSIAVDLYDTLHVVWQYTIGTTLKILYRKGYNNSWDDAISWSHGGVQENYLSVPAIHAIPVEIRQGETMQFVIGIMIVYRAPNGLKYVRYNKYDGWEGPDNVPSTSGDSHFPALEGTYGVFHLVWEEGGNIYYNCCEPPNSWGTKEKIPPASWIKDCHHPSVTLDYSSRPNVTWDAFSMVSQARDIIVARRVGSGWQMIGEFEYGEYPSIASYSTKDDLVLTLRRFSGACLVKPGIYLVKYSNGSWTQPTFIGSGVYPNLNIKADGHLVVWRGGSSAPYPIETYAVSEGKIASGGAQEVSNDKIPISFALAGYPNPFGGHTTIRYGIPAKYESKVISSIPVSLRIYDITGKLVKTLIDKTQEPGYFTITWNGRDEAGRKVSKGIYFYCLKAGSYIETKKLALLE
ncbi:MAG: FlgD immunoglobulin-like domain containing protein, partial [candidate division WOR-3 bacterium]|nr:FlgD immunoglobulin-like domain containing protein [candidate division WOR-3 bacterium]